MRSAIRKLGDRLLSLVVPTVEAQAAGVGTNTVVFCYCSNCRARYKNCNNGVCGSCNLLSDCC